LKGVSKIIATSAVGSIQDYLPGDLVLLEQFIDFVSPPMTFFDGKFTLKFSDEKIKAGVIHTDLTVPYCPVLREEILTAGRELQIPVKTGGRYVITHGPRFETPAEINIMREQNLGNLVGMTNPPEAILARELEIHYACIALVTNYAAGQSKELLSHSEVTKIFNSKKKILQQLILQTLKRLDPEIRCNCITYLK
jgi:5'-methylthioadenosine phosphorylase